MTFRFINYSNFIIRLEKQISELIRDSFPRQWDENYLSLELIKRLRQEIDEVEIGGLERPFRLSCDAFKLKGKLETNSGDIAILVKFKSWEGEELEGVGFLEAKRKYETGRYNALDIYQLEKIKIKTPAAYVLLYDWNQITGFSDNLAVTDFRCLNLLKLEELHQSLELLTLYTHALVLPINTVISLGKNTSSLHKYGIPLSLQLCTRLFRGFDLEYKQNVVDAVKGYASDNYNGVNYVLAVGVSTGSDDPPNNFEINQQFYERIDFPEIPF